MIILIRLLSENSWMGETNYHPEIEEVTGLVKCVNLV